MKDDAQRHREVMDRIRFCACLGAGALAVGVGAALVVGSGTAHADSVNEGGTSVSAATEGVSGRMSGPAKARDKSPAQQKKIVESLLRSSEHAVPVGASEANRPARVAFVRSANSARFSPNLGVMAQSTLHAVGSRAAGQLTTEEIAAVGDSPRGFIAAGMASAVTPNPPATQGTAIALATSAPAPRASAVSTLTPKDNVDILFSGLNGNIGWIPGVGSAINGVKFAVDAVSLAFSVASLNLPQAITELGNLAVDTIGLVPVVGAPVASLLSQTLLGVNSNLGFWVQQSLQEAFDTNSTWSEYQFYINAVDVSVGLGGSQTGTATVSKPNYAGVGVVVDIVNTGFEFGWSIPLEGRFQLLALAFS